MAELLFQGHGSFRIISDSGFVIYVDPFMGEGYDKAADLILITHEHFDHNDVALIKKTKKTTRILRSSEALKDGEYQTFEVGGVKIEAVEAYNKNHKKEECVGYILSLDGISLYASGDTSETEQMKSFKDRALDWALFPTDGKFNMSPEEATHCAELIGAKNNVPIHMMPGKDFDAERAELFKATGRVIMRPGETVKL
jgi:L-ascorbate metabolism protein UlaG (beta-lactamase superfamily)